MKKISLLVLVVLSLGMISSCDSNTKDNKKPRQSMLYTSGGRPSEVLIVMAEQNWKMSAGDTIRNTLGEVAPWMAQNEPEYRLAQIDKFQFGIVYKKFRNILIVKFDKSYKKSKVKVKHNVWSRPQTVVTITSPNIGSFITAYGNTYEQIKEYYHKNELYRVVDAYERINVKSISKRMQEKFSFKMVVPKGYSIVSDKADFMRIVRLSRDMEEGLLIYTFPYSDTSDFNYHNIIALRDSLTKIYIPGPVDSSYMKVSSFFPPAVYTVKFNGNYATEIRSLWDVHGYALGGPYMSYTFVDTIANRMVMIDGYIQAPRKEKRDIMLRIEAILGSFEFVNETEPKNN